MGLNQDGDGVHRAGDTDEPGGAGLDDLRFMADQAADCIFIKDERRRYTFVNRAMQTLLGRGEADLVGKTPEEVFGPDQAAIVRAVDDRTFSGESVDETRDLALNGLTRRFHTVQTPLRRREGRVVAIMGIVRDVTAQREAERREADLRERLAGAERMESLGVLAGGIAHDLNNLLSPNVSLPALILEDLQDLTPAVCPRINEVRELLTAIEQSSVRAAETIKDISSLSRIQGMQRVPLEVNTAVHEFMDSRECAELRRGAPDVRIELDLDGGSLWVNGSPSHLRRVVANLVRNALLSIEGAGTVTISTARRTVSDPVVGFDVVEPGPFVTLSVRDTGGGIEPQVLKHVFEPFFNTHKQANRVGSGLGLSVVHGVVCQHEGAMEVHTQAARGTVFRAWLPEIAGPADAEADDGPVVRGGSEYILVVDDEPVQLFAASRVLRRKGYRVSTAANGHEALAVISSVGRTGAASPFDLVILDVLMEPGFDGIQTLREIRERCPEQKALVVSGYAADAEAETTARKMGADWLAKPYRAVDFLRAVRRRLDAGAQG